MYLLAGTSTLPRSNQAAGFPLIHSLEVAFGIPPASSIATTAAGPLPDLPSPPIFTRDSKFTLTAIPPSARHPASIHSSCRLSTGRDILLPLPSTYYHPPSLSAPRRASRRASAVSITVPSLNDSRHHHPGCRPRHLLVGSSLSEGCCLPLTVLFLLPSLSAPLSLAFPPAQSPPLQPWPRAVNLLVLAHSSTVQPVSPSPPIAPDPFFNSRLSEISLPAVCTQFAPALP